MAVAITIPASGELGDDIAVVDWLVEPGDSVSVGDPVVEIEAGKGVLEIEAVTSGTLLVIVAAAGESVGPGSIVGYIGEPGETIPSGEEVFPTPAPDDVAPDGSADVSSHRSSYDPVPGKIAAVPAARTLARSHGVDLAMVTGTAAGGIIKKSDVERFLSETEAGNAVREPRVGTQDRRLNRNQEIVASVVSRSHREIPVARFRCEIEMKAAVEVKNRGYAYDAILLFAASRALRKFPLLHSTLDGRSLVRPDGIDIAVAVGIGDALYMPVVRRAHEKGLQEIDRIIREFAESAREGSLRADGAAHGGFLVTNLGMYPVIGFDAIIPPGMGGALSCGTIRELPFRGEAHIEFKSVMEATLAVDHRLTNGRTAAEFLTTYKKIVEGLDEWLQEE